MKKKSAIITFLLFYFFISPLVCAGYMKVYYLVPNQEVIYIELPNGKNVMIDGGSSSAYTKINAFLQSKSVTTINFMALSHDHTDHFGGLKYVMSNYVVENFYCTGSAEEADMQPQLGSEGCPIYNPTAGEYISGPSTNVGPGWDNDVICKVLAANDAASDNNRSLVLKVSLGSASFLFGGDAESSVESGINSSDLANTDFYKVHHHGSATSSRYGFLTTMKPQYAIQMDGGTVFSSSAFDNIIDYTDAKIYRNNLDGDIIVKCDNQGNYDIVRECTYPDSPSFLSGVYSASPPALPTGLTVTDQTAISVTLDWNNTTLDTQGNSITCAYDVFRATCSGGAGGAGFDTQPGMAGDPTGIYKKITASPVSDSSYIDTTIDSGEDYYYRVSAVRTDYYYERRYSNEVFVVGDTVAPEAVADLFTSTGNTYGEIKLQWTAPHEDGAEGGSVSSYDLRYATFTLSDTTAWWNNYSYQASGEPTPGDPGITETMTIGNLTGGVTYYFGIKSTDDEDNLSSIDIKSSAGNQAFAFAKTDATPSSPPGIVYDGNTVSVDVDYFGSTTTISANWSAASDGESGIAGYRYAVGTSSSLTDITGGWIDAGSNISVTKSGLSLSHGTTYYFLVKAENGQGLLSNITSSDGAVSDITPPSPPSIVRDGAGVDIAYFNSTTTISATWDAAADSESGIAGYWFAVGTSSSLTDITGGWKNAGNNTSTTTTGLSLINGVTYYFLVKAENNAGLESALVSSNGAVSDITPPSPPSTVWDGAGVGVDIAYFNSTTTISANWDAASDSESGIAGYRFAISSKNAGGAEFLGWQDNGVNVSTAITGLNLENGVTYYFTVKAENSHGLLSESVSSDGAVPDVTPPYPPAVVNDGEIPDNDIVDFPSTTTISATWDAAADSESGIAGYWFAIGESSFTTEISTWEYVGSDRSVTKTGLSLDNGTTYYFLVKAENGVGLKSAPASSNGQVVDIMKPRIDSLTSDTHSDQNEWYSATEISYTWTGIDPSGGSLVFYYLLDGMEARTTDYIMTNDLSTTETNCVLTAAQEGIWYFHLIASSTATGKLSNVSNFMTKIDVSSPSAITTVNDGTGEDESWTPSTTTLSANWTISVDTLSGIAAYWFAVGTSSSLTDITGGWKNAGNNTSTTTTGLSLFDKVAYYFLVKAENGAGLFSPASASDGQIVDIVEPTIDSLTSLTHPDQSKWYSGTTISYNWTGSAPSGVRGFYYLLDSMAARTTDYIMTNGYFTTETNCALTAAQEGTWYFHLIVESEAETLSDVSNYRTQIDVTSPSAITVVNDGTGEDIGWAGSSTTLSANWTISVDTLSGIAAYWYAIGTSSSTADILNWESAGDTTTVTKPGLPLIDGEIYYFLVKAENGAGLFSPAAASAGQIVDVTKPAINFISAKYGVSIDDFPEILFDEKISTAGINQMVSLEVIRDNLGIAGSSVPIRISHDTNTNITTFIPVEGGKLKNNYFYELNVSSDITDITGNKLGVVETFEFSTLMNPDEENIVYASFEENEKVCVEIPAGAFSENAYVIISTKEINNSVPKLSPEDDTFCVPLSSSAREFTAYNSTGAKIAVNTGNKVAVTLAYENLPVNIDTETVNVWYLDEDKNVLIKLPGASINKVNKTVSADVYHLSSFVLAGESITNLMKAYAYPVPYKPSDGKDETGTDRISFANLGSKATIKIYTISGELVKTLHYLYSSGEMVQEWYPVTNESNEKVASGLYIYYISNGVEEKHGNLIIIR
ncbi:MAG: MBL fold metallo-hydrolase [bacterium]